MNRSELLRAWVAALESGQYKQGRGALRVGDSYCCLGVFCDISGRGVWNANRDQKLPTFEYEGKSHGMFLPISLLEEIRLSYGDQGELTRANDNGKTFGEIAQQIREWFPDVFPVAA